MQRSLLVGSFRVAVALLAFSSVPFAVLGLPASMQLTGNVESQTLLRHADIEHFQLVQNRNTFRLRAEWDWLRDGKILGERPFSLGSASRLTLSYRGVYDSFYDIAPGDLQHGQERTDDLVGGYIVRLSRRERDHLKFENDLREAYLDFSFSDVPISLRLGRQQVVWGESDHFRLMDIWNPLDLRWHMHQEPAWDDIRVPLWLFKGIWNVGKVGVLSDVSTEVVYNPGDYEPGIIADYLPRPWALPIPNPLRQGQVQFDPITNALYSPQINLQGTSDRRGDFRRNPAEASEIGTRVHVTTPQGIEATANYFYGRGRNVGAAQPFALRVESIDLPALPGFGATSVGSYQPDINDPAAYAAYPVNVKAKVVHPYMHIFGMTLKYFERKFTATSFRMETAYVMGSPFQSIEPDKLVRTTLNGKDLPLLQLPYAPLGFTKRDVWAGMLGFDRPTLIRRLNAEAPWVFSGQFFWTYTTGGHVDLLRGNAGTAENPYFGPIGRWASGAHAGQIERQQNARIVGDGDNIRRWEHLITLTMTSTYRHGTITPVLADVFDPVNLNNTFFWSVDYFLTNEIILTLRQSFYTDFGARYPSNDPWFAGGRLNRRDETVVKLTYQF
ncbi:MAG: hypothetical protein HY270_01995 [Deltaproteobacteria bacterium]|nr:hypothetical protein [Deltaproteobacteria bacterium]